ncbi:MAG: hypothetical protein ABIH72_04640 [archaeon]
MNKQSFYDFMNKTANKVGIGIAATGLTAQALQVAHLIPYSFVSGQFGDFGTSLALTTWFNGDEDQDDIKSHLKGAFLISIYWTAVELLQKAHIWPGTYDLKDIAAFWAGSATAFALGRLASSDKFRNTINSLETQLNPKKYYEKIRIS